MTMIKLLILCFCSLCSIQAAAIGPQLSLVNETASSTGLLSPSSLSLSAPVTPDGFDARLTFDQTHPLNAYDLWTSALEAMHELVRRGGWNEILETELWVMAFRNSHVHFLVEGVYPMIKLGYIAIALYNAVNAMFSLQPGFFVSVTELVLHGRQIGSVKIQTQSVAVGDGAGHALNGNNTVSSTTIIPEANFEFLNATTIKYGGNNNSDNSLVLKGDITDPDDDKLRVEWEYQRVVSRSDLWTAALDGMVTAMQYDSVVRCNYVTAVSVSGNLVIHISGLSNHVLNYGVALKTFWLIARVSLADKVYREMDLSILYAGSKVGEGYVLSLRRAGLVDGGQAAVSER